MINWNDLKNLDVKNFDLTKIDLTKLDACNLELPNLDLPTFDLPQMPEFALPIEADRLVGLARDAAYASVGAVVIGLQQADERRRELTDQVTAQVRKLVDAVA